MLQYFLFIFFDTMEVKYVLVPIDFHLGMHDIYRTDKLSTNMGENYVIFIALINEIRYLD